MSSEMSKPIIEAELLFDANGKPEFVQRGRKHYRINLKTKNAPQDTYAVTYLLDESYQDPVREVRDRDSHFQLQTTSFGDYKVSAQVRRPTGISVVTVGLADALLEKYGDSLEPAVQEALRDIREN